MTEIELEDAAVGYALGLAVASGDPTAVDDTLAEIQQRYDDWPAMMARTCKYLAEGVLEPLLSSLGGKGDQMRTWLSAYLAGHLSAHPWLVDLPGRDEHALGSEGFCDASGEAS